MENAAPLSIITPHLELLINLFRRTYLRVVPSFVNIRIEKVQAEKYLQLEVEHNFRKLIAWILHSCLISIPTLIAGTYLLLEYFFFPPTQPESQLSLLHVITFIFVVVWLIFYWVTCRNAFSVPENVQGFNLLQGEMLRRILTQVSSELHKPLRENLAHSFCKKATDFLHCFHMHVLVLLFLPVACYLSFLELDVYWVLMNRLVLPHEQSILFAIVSKLISFLGITTTLFEVVRELVLLSLVLTYAAQQFVFCCEALRVASRSEIFALRYYESFRVLSARTYTLFEVIRNVLYFAIFLLTYAAWFAIKGHGILPSFLVFSASLVFTDSLVVSQFMLKWAIKVGLTCEHVIWERTKGRRKSTSKYFLKRWNAQPVIYLRCGGRFRITNEAAMIYLDVVITNITNAVLLIQPPAQM